MPELLAQSKSNVWPDARKLVDPTLSLERNERARVARYQAERHVRARHQGKPVEFSRAWKRAVRWLAARLPKVEDVEGYLKGYCESLSDDYVLGSTVVSRSAVKGSVYRTRDDHSTKGATGGVWKWLRTGLWSFVKKRFGW